MGNNKFIELKDKVSKVIASINSAESANKQSLTESLKQMTLGNVSTINDSKFVKTVLSEKIDSAGTGNPADRLFVIAEIKSIILKNFSNIVTKATIDSIIKSYHINYYESLYTGELSGLQELLDENFKIDEDASFDTKLDRLSELIYQENYGLSVIDKFEFIEDINEVACNGDSYIWIQYSGIKVHLPKLRFYNEKTFKEVVKKACSFDSKLDINEINTEVLCQRFIGSRVTAFNTPYVSRNQLNIRNFDVRFRDSSELISKGVTTEEIEEIINRVQKGRPGIIICGDQGAGKTTYLERLVSTLSDDLAIGTIEPNFELNIAKKFPTKNVVEMQTLKDKSAEDMFESMLRVDRDLIINGEIRSPEEAVVTLKAMSRQGRGSMGTFHTTSIYDFPYDYRNLLMQSGNYTSERTAELDIARAIDLVILLRLNRQTGKRFIWEIAEIENVAGKDTPFRLNSIIKKTPNGYVSNNRLSKWFIQHLKEYDFTDEDLVVVNNILSKLGSGKP